MAADSRCIAKHGRGLYEPGACYTLARREILSDRVKAVGSSSPRLAKVAMDNVYKVRETTPRRIK